MSYENQKKYNKKFNLPSLTKKGVKFDPGIMKE